MGARRRELEARSRELGARSQVLGANERICTKGLETLQNTFFSFQSMVDSRFRPWEKGMNVLLFPISSNHTTAIIRSISK